MAQQGKSIFEKPLLSTKVKSANVKLVESLIGYLIGPFCAMLANGIFTTYLTRYFRDVLFAEELMAGSPHVATVETFLTLFPILSAILIVIGNLVAGQIVERTRTKAGKARPWILLSSVLLAVSSVLMFIQPSNDLAFKAVWLVIAYNLYYAVAFPLYNTANSTLTPLSTRNGKQRSVLASFVNMSLLGSVGAGSMVFPFLLGILIKPEMSLGTQKNYWLILFIVVAVVTFLGTVLQYFFTRERVTEEQLSSPAKNEGKSGISVRQQAKSIASDRFFWIIIIFYLLYQFSGGIKNTSMNFYAEILANETLSTDSITGTLGIIGAVPMAAAVVFIAPLCNKFGKQKITILGMIVGVIGGLVAGIWYDNFVIAAIGIALKCLGSAPAGYMILAMIADCLDHIEAKTGKRCDGFVMSIYSSIMIASTPVAQGITSALVGGSQTGAVIAYIWIETVCYGLGAVILIFYTVEKLLAGDRKTILERQKAQAEAAGIEWIEPEERLRLQEEEEARIAEEARKAELKARCEKKGLDYEKEEAAYQAKLAKKQSKKKT